MEEFFAKGKRSNAYLTIYNKKKAVIKKAKEGSIGAISDEALWLRKLNIYGIGPKLFYSDDDKVIIEYVKGKRILEFLPNVSTKKALLILKDVFRQCRLLDKLKISKEEMQNPYKHILVDKKAVMIDFEKCHYAEKPQNVTQFCQFVMSGNMSRILKPKGIMPDKDKSIELLKEYKRDYSEKTYRELLKVILKH